MPITVVARSGQDLKEIRSRASDGTAIGNIVARTLEAVSQKAFQDQKLGDDAWPERYPSMEDPFVNVAALVNWANEGGSITSRFFDRRPALVGTGDLKQSISGRVSKGLVEVGSALGYASVHQFGGVSTQRVTGAAKATIAKFIGEESDGKGGWRKSKRKLTPTQKAQRDKYWFRLFPVLGQDEITTQVNRRPFLGITKEAEEDMIDGIEAYIAHGGR